MVTLWVTGLELEHKLLDVKVQCWLLETSRRGGLSSALKTLSASGGVKWDSEPYLAEVTAWARLGKGDWGAAI